MSETVVNTLCYPSQFFTFSPAPGQAQIYGIQFMGAFHPGSLILSDTSTNTKIEVSNSVPSGPNGIQSVSGDTVTDNGLWTTLTNAAIIKLDCIFSAIRVTNMSGNSTIRVDLAI